MLDVSKLKKDMVFKNYKELSLFFGEGVKSGKSKKYQIIKWKRYFSFKRNKQCYIIVDVYKKPIPKPIHNTQTHGMHGSKIYGVWTSMKSRCLNKNCNKYVDYGGRGISICNEWLNKEDGFMNFYNWAIENGYKEGAGLSIDRVNVNGNYEPSNCEWVTQKIQMWNTRKTIHVPGKLQMTKAELIEYLKYLEEYLNDSDQTDIIEQYIY